MKFKDGSVYYGNWKANNMSGFGSWIMDGNQYNGDWHNGIMHGEGELTFGDGLHYFGQFSGGYMHGRGKLTTQDGSYYDGQWARGLKNGIGVQYFPNRETKRKESWNEGKFVKVLKYLKHTV